ncbi:hypothetical protein THAOC_21350 [Thalassiosira oceanica]|uniref:Uncharacterized protein n=1 Tax=Thalassiosira oceanica TaxID=159749 RepID=K0S191_THAOC|nr:hypothetical protein THAOC_21350 [Thalassiosira oceanica]|eukprot:EJK58524.1 hypothetical protein THAOC_21350 [Thalassiosira oceanica]
MCVTLSLYYKKRTRKNRFCEVEAEGNGNERMQRCACDGMYLRVPFLLEVEVVLAAKRELGNNTYTTLTETDDRGPERGRASSAFRTQSNFPPGPNFLGGLLVTKQHLVGLGPLGRHNDDRESRAPPWPPLVARRRRPSMAPIHPQYIPYEGCGRRAIPNALRPPLSLSNEPSRCNGKFVHHQTSPTSPAYRGLGAVDNVTSIEAGGY